MSNITTLADSLLPFRRRFNRVRRPRFLALVSPTCGPCVRGATAVREVVVPEFHAAGFPVFLVWIPMLVSDTQSAIFTISNKFNIERLTQYSDAQQKIGGQVASSLGATDAVAWDIYLFYGHDARWDESAPNPIEWVHQLQGYPWVDSDRYRCGAELITELDRLSKHIVRRYSGE